MKNVKKALLLLSLVSAAGLIAAENPSRKCFSSADEAIRGLKQATQAKDRAALHGLFGPDLDRLLTGDEVQDANNFKRFTEAVDEKCVPVQEGEGRLTLEIGKEAWPFPIPLASREGKWFFDTDAGLEEVINRHIGSDELHAIGVCRAYVEAQQQYALQGHDGKEAGRHALKFKSGPGKEDGLYWENGADGHPAPLQALVEEAHAEGYGKQSTGGEQHPFHGYLFRILTRQGRSAGGGKKDYMKNGDLIDGFALVAYPVQWGRSGVMTFIVNNEGKIYQRNLGSKTAEIGSNMSEYNPTSKWTLVTDTGLIEPRR